MTEPPRTMGITSGFSRQYPIDATFAQFLIASPTALPLLPHITPQPAAYPTVKVSQHRGRLAESKVSMPAPKIKIQLLNHFLQGYSSCAPRNFPNSFLETNQRLRSYTPSMWLLPRKTESQKFALPWPPYRAFLTVNLQLQLLADE